MSLPTCKKGAYGLYEVIEQMTYCKRGYFRWGKISRKCWQDISRRGNFEDSTNIYFIKTCGFYFRVRVIFVMKTKAQKMRKLPPCENFRVYSKWGNNNVTSQLDCPQVWLRSRKKKMNTIVVWCISLNFMNIFTVYKPSMFFTKFWTFNLSSLCVWTSSYIFVIITLSENGHVVTILCCHY